MVDAEHKKARADKTGRRTRTLPGPQSAMATALGRVLASADRPEESFIAAQTSAADRLSETLGRYLHELAEQGVELTALGEPEEVAASVIERLPLARSRMAAAVGPCYTSGGLQAVLGMSRAALSKAALERRALRLETSDGHTVYPAFQVYNSALVPELRKVLSALAGAVDDPWAWAVWLNAPIGDERAPSRRIDQLGSGDVDGVVRAAMQTAAAWAA